MWIATHIGPGGLFSRLHSSEWVEAANVCRALMECSYPEGVHAAMLRLRDATVGEPFEARVGGHTYTVERDIAAPRQSDLFGAD